jgi:aryl-alcohol dehydrogenase-like predicted oxidoreductase
MDVRADGTNLFQVVQATWNLLEPSAGPALADAKAQGLGVIVKEGLANGRLTDRNTESRVASLRRHAASRGTTADAMAFAAIVTQPWADVVLSGAVTNEQLTSNLRGLTVSASLDDLPDVAEPAVDYWSRRGALAWR